MDIERFRGNPVMLFNHCSGEVIGRWTNIRREDNRLLADAEFDADDPLGKEVARKVEKGFLKGCSAGLLVRRMTDTDEGLVATATELMEASIVAVPSDAGAVALYDENRRPVTLEALKLNFHLNSHKSRIMDQKIELTAGTLTVLGLGAGATAVQIEQAVSGMSAKVASLEAKVSAFEKEKVIALVGRAIAEKKIGADERDTYVSLAEKDFSGVERILAKMQGVTPVAGALNARGAAAKYEGRTWDELDRAGLLAALKAEAPELYRTKYEEKFTA
jgi:HK97 family phage prohead protease